MNRFLLKARIMECGTSQKKLAGQLEISENSFSKKLCGKCEFTLKEVQRLCILLDITDPRPIFFS